MTPTTTPTPRKRQPATPEMERIMVDFGKQIAAAMKQNDITKEQLADKLQVTVKYVTRMLNGNRAKMGVEEMQKIAKAVGHELDFDFAGGGGNGDGEQQQNLPDDLGDRLDDLEKIAAETLDKQDVVEICHSEVGPVLEDFSNRIEQLQKPNHFFVTTGKATYKIEGRAHQDLKKVLSLASSLKRDNSRHNILMIGPAGCGKTYLARQLAEIMELEFGYLSLSEGISESHLIGRNIPTGAQGQMEYKQSTFVRLFTDGGVFLADEMDGADPNVLVQINSAIANGWLRLPNDEERIRHPDFVLLAAANTYGHGADRMYVGRNQLDAATIDRFAVGKVEMDYDESLERSASHPDLCHWAQGLRKKARKAMLRRVISTRFIFDASDAIQAGALTLKEAKQSLLMDWNKKDLQSVGEL